MGLPMYQPPEKVKNKSGENEDQKDEKDEINVDSSTGGLKRSLPSLETMDPQALREIVSSSMAQLSQDSQMPTSQLYGAQETSNLANYDNGNWGLWVPTRRQINHNTERIRSGQSLQRPQRPPPLIRANTSTSHSTLALTDAAYYDPDNHMRQSLPTIFDVDDEEEEEEELTSLQSMLQVAMSQAIIFERYEMLAPTARTHGRFMPTLATCEEGTEEIEDGFNEADLEDWDVLNGLEDLDWDHCEDNTE